MSRLVVLDTETTGLSPENGDRIIEIGCVELLNRRLSGTHKHFYLNPERPSHEDAVKIHGLTDEFLADKPKFAEVVDDLMAYLAGAEIIIHNAAFDVGFLDKELERLGRPRFAPQVGCVTDTLAMAREIFPGKSNSLDALCKRLEVDNTHRTLHGALLDAGLLAEVYIRLTRGQETLAVDADDSDGGRIQIARIDLTQFTLPVLLPSEEELVAHEALLAELDRASGGRTLWRSMA